MQHIHILSDPFTVHPTLHRRAPARHHADSSKPSFSRTSSNGGRPMACPLPRRSKTTSSQDYARFREDPEPWVHMAKTYAWVIEQELAEMTRKNEETVQWIRRQQERDRREKLKFPGLGNFYARMMVDLDEVEDKHRQRLWEEQAKRRETHHHYHGTEFTVQEELHQWQARRRHTDRCREAYCRRKALEAERDRERRKQDEERVHQADVERRRWQDYEDRWSHINSPEGSSEHITFATLPWPMLVPPRTVEDIRPARIAAFLLSSHHSEGQSIKDRVRHALRRWHPDRFGRLLVRAGPEERVKIEEGAGIVARCLSDLLERAG